MGPMPRGPLILCIGPKLGWPGGQKREDLHEERSQEIISLLQVYVV